MYNQTDVNNEINHIKSFLNLSEPYYEDIALIVTVFKDKIVKKYNLNMDEFYTKLSKLKSITEIDYNPDFLGLFNPNIDNGTAYDISILKDAKNDDFLRRYILAHELIHLFSSTLNSEKFILNNNNFANLRNINEILTEKFTSTIIKELFEDYDTRIHKNIQFDDFRKDQINTNPVGLGYPNISEISNVLFNLFEKEIVSDFFDSTINLIKSNKFNMDVLDKSLNLVLKDMNTSNVLQVNKPVLDLFKSKVFNEDMTFEFLINYLKKSQEVIKNFYTFGKDDFSFMKQSFETIDAMIYCKFFKEDLIPLSETRDHSKSFEVENFITVLDFLRNNSNVLDKLKDINDIDYKCIYDDSNKRVISFQIKNEDVEEYYDIKYMKKGSNRVSSTKINITKEIYESENEIKYEYKIVNPELDFEKIISENNRRNHAFIQKNQENKNLKYIYTFLDEALDNEYQKTIIDSDIFNNLKDTKNRNMSYLLTSSSDYNMDIVIRFLKQKTKIKDLINEPDIYGKTTVDYLIERGDITRLNTILKRLDLDNNYNLLKNENLLIKAAILGKNDILSYLNNNEIGLDIKDSKGNNLFFIALENIESMNSTNLVKNNNYQNFVSRNNIDYKNNNGENLINFYCKHKNLNPLTVEKILEKYKLDIDSKDNQGNTPLTNLIKNCNDENFENSLISMYSLLSKGANPEIENKDGCTSLQLSVFSLYTGKKATENDYKIIETLVKCGADINKENDYISPLNCACKTKNIEVLKAFVRGGINVNEIINKPIFKENFISDKRRELRVELRRIAIEINNQSSSEKKKEEQELAI